MKTIFTYTKMMFILVMTVMTHYIPNPPWNERSTALLCWMRE